MVNQSTLLMICKMTEEMMFNIVLTVDYEAVVLESEDDDELFKSISLRM